MKLGIVVPTYVYKPERHPLAEAFFASLCRTVVRDSTPLLVIVERPTDFRIPLDALRRLFWVETHGNSHEGVEFQMSEQPAVFGTDLAFARGADYVTHLNDDALVAPRWIWRLEAIIERRPDAKAWSVYRSAHAEVHKPLTIEGPDVLVRSLCGLGITFSRQEWETMGVNWRDSQWLSPSGSTLDLWHAHNRPGERWCTRDSYIEHMGRDGIHAKPWIPEHAVNFVGEG